MTCAHTHVWRLGLTSTRAQCDPEARGCRGPGDPSWPYARRGGTGIPVPPVLWLALHLCVEQNEESACHFRAFLMVRKGGVAWWDMVSVCFSGSVPIL